MWKAFARSEIENAKEKAQFSFLARSYVIDILKLLIVLLLRVSTFHVVAFFSLESCSLNEKTGRQICER